MARIVLVFVFFALLVSCGTMKPYSGMDRDKRLIKTYLAVKLDSVFSTDFKIKEVRYNKKAMRDSLSRRIVTRRIGTIKTARREIPHASPRDSLSRHIVTIETSDVSRRQFYVFLSNGKIDSVKAYPCR